MDKEKEIALKFLNEHKDNEVIRRMIIEVSEMTDVLHSDRWSYVYDTIFSCFNRGEVPGIVVTGLTYLIEEKGKELI